MDDKKFDSRTQLRIACQDIFVRKEQLSCIDSLGKDTSLLQRQVPHRNQAVEVWLKNVVPEGVVSRYPWVGESVVVKLNFPSEIQMLHSRFSFFPKKEEYQQRQSTNYKTYPIDGESDAPSRHEFGSAQVKGITAVSAEI